MTLRAFLLAAAVAVLAPCATALAATQAPALSATALLDGGVRDTEGVAAGRVTDLIVDVASQRVVYVVLERDTGGFVTLPVRALGADARVDLGEAQEGARWTDDRRSRLRRATSLLGEAVALSAAVPPAARVHDIRFAARTGRIERVIVATPQAQFSAGADLLSERRDPVHGEVDPRGFHFEPSDERTRLHDPRWDSQWERR